MTTIESRPTIPDTSPPWPLPLTAFETYMYADDLPAWPMAFVIRIVASGELDRDAFTQALHVAVARHPLLGAVVVGRNVERLSWMPATEPVAPISFGALGEPLRYPGGLERIDLRHQPGLRVWVREGGGRVEITLQFHHTATDGVGAYQFVEDLLAAYHAELNPDAADELLPPLDAGRLPGRGRFGLHGWRQWLRMPLEIWGVVVGMLTFFLGRPSPIAAPHAPQPSDETLTTVLSMPTASLEADEVKRLVKAAKASRATVNDWLMRDTFRALAEWNVSHGPNGKAGNLRLMLPMNLREEADHVTPAANIVGMAFLDRWMPLFRNPGWLLTSIRLETAFLKRLRLPISQSRICALARVGPGWLDRLTGNPRRCYATGVLSNLGVVFAGSKLPRDQGKVAVGGLVVEAIESAPPVRSLCSIALTALTYGGRMTFILNYDRRRLTADDAQQFVDSLVARVRRTLADVEA